MKTIITTDNYEAYLLDYMEGNLSPDEAEQLKAFVAAQGLDWNELTEELPHLEAPQIAYEGKESLMQRSLSLSKGRANDNKRIVPLYVKIASAAAAAGLLLTVSLWPEKSMPKMESVAELKPILPTRLITSEENQTLPPRTISFAAPKTKVTKQKKPDRTPLTLLADLQPKDAKETQIVIPTSFSNEPDFDLMAYHMDAHPALAQYAENDFDDFSDDDEEDRELSLIGKGILLLTDGRHDSFASLINAGLDQAKEKATETATDMALTAYHRTDEYFEEAKERWEDKW